MYCFLKTHFANVIQNNHEFLELSFDEIKQILASGKSYEQIAIIKKTINPKRKSVSSPGWFSRVNLDERNLHSVDPLFSSYQNIKYLSIKHGKQQDSKIDVFFLFILDDINVQSEEIVFEAFLSWINYNSKRQTDRLAQLFGLIRLPLIDKKVCHWNKNLIKLLFCIYLK